MFSRIFVVAVVALPLFATASAVPRGGGDPSGQCNTGGGVQCCNQVGAAQTLAPSYAGSLIGTLLGLVVDPITAIVGINCTPIGVLGIGGNSCTVQPVCCTQNNFNGLVNVGCSPVNVNL